MKKIIIVHHYGGLGGGSISLIDIATMLKEDYEVKILIPQNSNSLKKLMNERKISFKEFSGNIPTIPYYSGGPNIFSRSFLQNFLFFNRYDELLKEIEEEKADLVILNSIVLFYLGRLLKKKKIKSGIFVRETFKENLLSKYICRKINDWFSMVFFISEYDKAYSDITLPSIVIADCLFPEIYHIKNRAHCCDELGITDKHTNVLFLGGDDPIKGLDTLLKALIICPKNITLLLAGNINIEHNVSTLWKFINFKKQSKKIEMMRNIGVLRKENRIKILGFTNDVSTLFSSCDMVVFPSKFPHQSRPAFEAGIFHKPVIISDFKQTSEFFLDNYNCRVFNHKDAIELAKIIQYLSSNKNIADYLGNNNNIMTNQQHNFEKEKEKLIYFLKSKF